MWCYIYLSPTFIGQSHVNVIYSVQAGFKLGTSISAVWPRSVFCRCCVEQVAQLQLLTASQGTNVNCVCRKHDLRGKTAQWTQASRRFSHVWFSAGLTAQTHRRLWCKHISAFVFCHNATGTMGRRELDQPRHRLAKSPRALREEWRSWTDGNKWNAQINSNVGPRS